MRRVPLVASFLLFLALCASLAYWGMQLFKPPLRPVAAPPRVAQAEIRPDAAAALFGASAGKVAVASNYQLKGVIFSGSPGDSVAIISADGKPAQAVRVDKEIAPGVTVKEVHREYVLLSEGGTTKRVELPEDAQGQGNLTMASQVPARQAPGPAPGQAIPPRAPAVAPAPQAPVVSSGPPTPVPGVPPAPVQVPGQAPVQSPAQAPNQAQVPGQVPAPAAPPPTVVVSPPPGIQQPGAIPAEPATAPPTLPPASPTVVPGAPATR